MNQLDKLDYSSFNLNRFLFATLTRLFELPTFMPKRGAVYTDPEQLTGPLVVDCIGVIDDGKRRRYEVCFFQGTTYCTMPLIPFLTAFVKVWPAR